MTLALAAGCFAPSYSKGSPCSPSEPCPDQLVCDWASATCETSYTATPTSCSGLLAVDASATTGLHNISAAGSAMIVYCDMTTAGGGWTEVMDQDCSMLAADQTTLQDWAGPFNADAPDQGQYSIANLIGQLKSGANFEFLLVYPTNPGGGTLQWTQVEDPTTFDDSSSRPTISGLTVDPSPMLDDCGHGCNQFSGLSLTVSGNSLLSGDSTALTSGNWWFAIGEVVSFYLGIPSYTQPSDAPYDGGSGTVHAKLFVR